MAFESNSSTHPGVGPLLLATAITILLSWIPFARVLTYPFAIFSTFIHETGHALAAVATAGSVESLFVHWDGSGVTYTRGGVRAIVSSAGYLGTAFFGGLLLLLSRNRKIVRPALVACAILVALITTAYVGRTSNLLVLIALSLISILVAASLKETNSTGRSPLLMIAGVLFLSLVGYLVITQSLFSWSVGLFATLGLLGIVRFASLPVAHFFLSFLAVQCSLNALESIYNVYSLSIRASCSTDAKAMESLTGVPAVFWAVSWAVVAIGVLIVSLWLFSRDDDRRTRTA